MENQEVNIILTIVEEINQEIKEDIGHNIDDFCLEFISDGDSGIILFLGIEIWNEEDDLSNICFGNFDTREFREWVTSFIWEKIKYIKEMLCTITQYREKKFNFKPSS